MSNPFRLLVYGTLKRGFGNHSRHCRDALDIQTAQVWGRLFELPYGYPGLVVDSTSVLATGSHDWDRDVLLQHQATLTPAAYPEPAGDWDWIPGEVMSFANPHQSMPPIDRLEGFTPGQASLYQRVLLLAEVEGVLERVWLYAAETIPNGSRRITRWPANDAMKGQRVVTFERGWNDQPAT
ncbi:AIG2 family protein [Gammaproteobacteria bacterium]